ncbi:galectin-5 [Anabrus simplex]|uniref:galectin-5 n=1 Tax=Anabrus simplex TaxID=316456 RepID=UPI0034DD8B8B
MAQQGRTKPGNRVRTWRPPINQQQSTMYPTTVHNPAVPYAAFIDGGFLPGKLLRVHGSVPHYADRFAINLECGRIAGIQNDIALHVNPRFKENQIVRNTRQNSEWGPEQRFGPLSLKRGEAFEIAVLCEPAQFKIAVNGQHLCDYPHRLQYHRISHLVITGDVTLFQVSFEGCAGVSPAPSYPVPYPVTSSTYPPQPL